MVFEVDNKEFLDYMKENDISNLSPIKSLKFNKKSISVKIDKDCKHFFFNDFFTEKHLYNIIISHLSVFTGKDRDVLRWRFKKLIVN